MSEEKPKEGRPTKYNDEYAKTVYGFCLLGYTDKELANVYDVSEVTINAWKNKHPEFLKSIREGKEIADSKVAESLFRLATGFKVKKTKFATHEGLITDSKEYDEDVIPNQRAAEFWLRNRQRGRWTNNPEMDSGTGDQAKALIYLPEMEEADGTESI
jgi:hypothetical protein